MKTQHATSPTHRPSERGCRARHAIVFNLLFFLSPLALDVARSVRRRQRDRAPRPSKILERVGPAAANRALRWQLEFCKGGRPGGGGCLIALRLTGGTILRLSGGAESRRVFFLRYFAFERRGDESVFFCYFWALRHGFCSPGSGHHNLRCVRVYSTSAGG